jgi:LysM repeat protein
VRTVTYTVQAGDTLSAIAQEHGVSLEALIAANDLADPDVLQVGQILTIPPGADDTSAAPASGDQPTTEPRVDRENDNIPATLTPGGPSLVEISEAVGIGALESETVTLSNQGGMVSLEGWTLSSASGDRFIFPALTLFPEGEVRVHSTTGDDTPQDLYWDRIEPAWEEGELITLRDADGNVVDTYILPE